MTTWAAKTHGPERADSLVIPADGKGYRVSSRDRGTGRIVRLFPLPNAPRAILEYTLTGPTAPGIRGFSALWMRLDERPEDDPTGGDLVTFPADLHELTPKWRVTRLHTINCRPGLSRVALVLTVLGSAQLVIDTRTIKVNGLSNG